VAGKQGTENLARLPACQQSKDTTALVMNDSSYLQTGPASVVNVLLSENQLFTAIEGAP